MKDLIIIGAGHAGVEAAHFANKLGLKTVMISFSINDIAYLPCNVSIGGSAKGIVVKELFALGGLMPRAADETQTQTKILNTSKGPAVRSLRAQVDKINYPKFMKKEILKMKNVEFVEAEVLNLILKNDEVQGVQLKAAKDILAKNVLITTGTFLNSKTMKGRDIVVEGPDGKKTNLTISEQLKKLGINTIRLKTGTPPRIVTDSIDFSVMAPQPGNKEEIYFTEKNYVKKPYQNVDAFLAYTNLDTHKIIQDNIEKSYLYSTEIKGSGPRYCPSIEDKIKRFAEKEKHQIFLEIESLESNTTYLAGLSSSLPKDVQEDFLRTIKGLENAKFEKYAYAIEYDAIEPTQFLQTLETKKLKNLYCAGQINGTSGYEEAAAQGAWAAINIANKILGREPFILGRDESYIGVMIDDITTKGITDPYRLLTSRAEYRLLLRTDNACKRLFEIAKKNHLLSPERIATLTKRFSNFEEIKNSLKDAQLKTSNEKFKKLLSDKKITLNVDSISSMRILKRPEFSFSDLREILEKEIPLLKEMSNEDLMTIEIEIKFKGYLERQEREVKKYKRLHSLSFSPDFDFSKVSNLALEAREKLALFKPNSIHQAQSIQGINPTDIMCLIQYLNKNHEQRK